MLFNLRTGTWDEELLKLFEIPRDVLPEVRSSSEAYAETRTGIDSVHRSRSPAIGRRLCLGRLVSSAGWRRTPTARVASCS